MVGVTHASINNWEYYDTIRRAAPEICAQKIQTTVETVDKLLANRLYRLPIKTLFGLPGITYDDDFASAIARPITYFQDQDWDPEGNDSTFLDFCAALGGGADVDADEALVVLVPDEQYRNTSDYQDALPGLPLDFAVVKYSNYVREGVAASPDCANPRSQDDVRPPGLSLSPHN